jgi:hypothetical protein
LNDTVPEVILILGPVRFAEKTSLKVLFADLLREKNTVRSLK